MVIQSVPLKDFGSRNGTDNIHMFCGEGKSIAKNYGLSSIQYLCAYFHLIVASEEKGYLFVPNSATQMVAFEFNGFLNISPGVVS